MTVVVYQDVGFNIEGLWISLEPSIMIKDKTYTFEITMDHSLFVHVNQSLGNVSQLGG